MFILSRVDATTGQLSCLQISATLFEYVPLLSSLTWHGTLYWYSRLPCAGVGWGNLLGMVSVYKFPLREWATLRESLAIWLRHHLMANLFSHRPLVSFRNLRRGSTISRWGLLHKPRSWLTSYPGQIADQKLQLGATNQQSPWKACLNKKGAPTLVIAIHLVRLLLCLDISCARFFYCKSLCVVNPVYRLTKFPLSSEQVNCAHWLSNVGLWKIQGAAAGPMQT